MPENIISVYIPKLHLIFACMYFTSEYKTFFFFVLVVYLNTCGLNE